MIHPGPAIKRIDMIQIGWYYTIFLTFFTGIVMSCSNNNGENGSLVVGDKAPMFEAEDSDGHIWKSADYVGKKVLVVYFYPVAMTGG